MTRNVGTPQEWGAKGYQVVLAKYGQHRMNQWRKKGGRKRNLTLAEIQAAATKKATTGPATTRATTKGAGCTAPTSSQPSEG